MGPMTDLLGDPLPPGAFARLGTVRLRQGLENFAVAFSPDGRLIASGGGNGRIYLWDTATGRPVRVLDGHHDKLYDLAWAAHGRWIASVGRDLPIRLWDSTTGRLLLEYDPYDALEAGPTAISVSSDSRRLAWTDYRGGCHLWDVTSRGWDPDSGRPPAEVWTGPTESRPTFFPDATAGDRIDRLVTVADGAVRFHDLESGEVLRTLDLGEPFDPALDDLVPCPAGGLLALRKGARSELNLLHAGSGDVQQRLPMPGRYPSRHVAWSPDGSLLATFVGPDDGTHLWRVGTGERLRTLTGLREWVRAITFSPDGKMLAAAHDGQPLWLWDVAAGERLLVYAGHEDGVHSVAFSPDGRQIATGGWHGEVATWDARTGRRLRRYPGHESDPGGRQSVRVAYHPDGRRLISSSDSTSRIHDLVAGGELRHGPFRTFMALGPRGEVYAGAYDDVQAPKAIRVWELASGRDLLRIPLSNERVRSWAFDPGCQVFAVALEQLDYRATWVRGGGRTIPPQGLRRTLQLWAIATGGLLYSIEGLEGSPNALKFSPDGRTLVAACEDRRIRAWDVAAGELRALGPEGTSELLLISPDGQSWATKSDGGEVVVWDAAAGQPRLALMGRHVESMAFSPDGGILAYSEYHQGVLLWDVGTGAILARIADPRTYYHDLAFSPDGAVLATARDDTTVLLWDLAALVSGGSAPSEARTAESG